jgi:hypothetical protein
MLVLSCRFVIRNLKLNMKIEHLLAQHFYAAKELTLQGIGKLTLSPDFVMPLETDKELVMPENAISFEYNNKATEDDAMINYIVQHTRKIKPLASADLDSYLMLGRQFLNIGKPFPIEGVGVLEKNQQGQYQFTQGLFSNQKAEVNPVALKEKREDEISFSSKNKVKETSNKGILIGGVLGLIALVSFAGWYFFMRDNGKENIVPTPVAEIVTKKDTVVNKPDSIVLKPTTTLPATNDSTTFKIVLKDYPTFAAANKSFLKLTEYGNKVILYTKDSVIYKVAMPFTKPLTDTFYVRDSLRKFFGGKPYVEIN